MGPGILNDEKVAMNGENRLPASTALFVRTVSALATSLMGSMPPNEQQKHPSANLTGGCL